MIAQLGSVVDAADPIAELRARGFTLAPALASKLDTPEAHARFRSAERQQLLAKVRGRPAPTVQLGPLTRNVFKLPGGHHDLTIGLKLEKINQVLADVYAKHSISRDLSLGRGKTSSSLKALLTVLRSELVGVPAGDDIRIGLLHVTGPPTVTALPTPAATPINITAHLLVHLPFSLDFDRIPDNGPSERAVANLRGVAEFGIAISARVSGNTLKIAAGPLAQRPTVAEPERLRLTINSDSALSGKNSGSGDRIGLAIEFGGFQSRLQDLAISMNLAPRIKLPVGDGFNLVVRHIDLRAVPSSGAGHLMIGLEIGAKPSSVPLSGQPELLERNPFSTSESTLYVEAHAELFKVLVKKAFASGELERLAREEVSNVRLSSAEAELGPNSIGVFLGGKLVDECGVFGEKFKDVHFEGWTRVELRGIDAGHIRFETVESLGLGNANLVDLAICVWLSFLDLKILILGRALLDAFFSKLSGWIFGSSSTSSTHQIVNVIASSPIPMTELIPRVRALSGTIDASGIRIQGALDLLPDIFSSYVYVRCVTEGPLTAGGGVPVKGVRVRLIDQDMPAPPGDDAPVPKQSTTVRPAGPRSEKTIDISFRPTVGDQQLATGTTNSEGRVRLLIPTGRLVTNAGLLTTTTTIQDTQNLTTISSSIQREMMKEKRPDVYLLLEQPNLPQVDTRNQGGFVLNLDLKHWGTAEQPLVFRVPQSPPVLKRG